jgi:hypothetical protein
MAHYVPPKTEYIHGLKQVSLSIETFDPKWVKRFGESVRTSLPININRQKFFVTKFDYNNSLGVEQANVTLIASGKVVVTEKFIRQLKSIGSIQWEEEENPIAVKNPGYVKHEFTKKDVVDKDRKLFVYTEDIIPDKDGNTFQTNLYQESKIWCEECRDVHEVTETITMVLSKNKKDALKHHNKFLGLLN